MLNFNTNQKINSFLFHPTNPQIIIMHIANFISFIANKKTPRRVSFKL